jgi:polar amino acid transport system substrate-binding protein
MRRTVCALVAMAGLLLGACGDDDDDDAGSATSGAPAATGGPATSAAPATTAAPATSAAPATTAAPATSAAPATTAAANEAAACAQGKTLNEGELVVATGEPAFPPYVIDDAPESGQGFEAAVAYAVAGEMGFTEDQVTWVRTTFEGAIQPGPKNFDFNLQQYSISPEREQVVSFSEPYYAANQAILGYADSPAAQASTAAAVRDLRIGVAAGTTSLTFVTDVLQPTRDPFVYNDNAAAKQALDTQQIDAIVADLPTALFISAVEIEGTQVFGQFPPSEGTQGEPWGLLFAKDNPLVECANLALAALRDSGALEEITVEWMSGSVNAPEIALD